MYDVRLALTDMAHQLNACRARDGLTLQQLATRCGVAASTIHKIEAQQMVPTITVLLKISRGLGCRPEELVRDRYRDALESRATGRIGVNGAGDGASSFERGVGAWRVDYARGERIERIALEPGQRATLFVERGQGELASDARRVMLCAGECAEFEGESFAFSSVPTDPVAALLIVSPIGHLAGVLGPPNAAPRPRLRPTQPQA